MDGVEKLFARMTFAEFRKAPPELLRKLGKE
jgi:hypothetical protein